MSLKSSEIERCLKRLSASSSIRTPAPKNNKNASKPSQTPFGFFIHQDPGGTALTSAPKSWVSNAFRLLHPSGRNSSHAVSVCRDIVSNAFRLLHPSGPEKDQLISEQHSPCLKRLSASSSIRTCESEKIMESIFCCLKRLSASSSIRTITYHDTVGFFFNHKSQTPFGFFIHQDLKRQEQQDKALLNSLKRLSASSSIRTGGERPWFSASSW